MISEDSPLRKLPHGLNPKQIVFLDALRISAEIAGQAYEELMNDLRLLSKKTSDQSPNYVRVVRNAWTLVDAVHRFRAVLRQMPGIEHNEVFELFMRRTEKVEGMRNATQHLNNELDGIARRKQGAYGTLTWVVGAGDERPVTMYGLNLGATYGGFATSVVKPGEHIPSGDIQRVRLELANRRTNLADIRDHVYDFVQSIEGSLAEEFAGKARYGADMFVGFEVTPTDASGDQ